MIRTHLCKRVSVLSSSVKIQQNKNINSLKKNKVRVMSSSSLSSSNQRTTKTAFGKVLESISLTPETIGSSSKIQSSSSSSPSTSATISTSTKNVLEVRPVSSVPLPSLSQKAALCSTSSKPPPPIVRTASTLMATADLCDQHIPSPTRLQIVQPNLTRFYTYGKKTAFQGRIHTVRCFESNPLVRELLSSPPLVVDGGGSYRCAIMGDMLATFAIENGWNGVVINGCIRDSKIINGLEIGVKALGTHPVKSLKDYRGEKGGRISFGGVEFVEGDHLYSDEDGIVVSQVPLALT